MPYTFLYKVYRIFKLFQTPGILRGSSFMDSFADMAGFRSRIRCKRGSKRKSRVGPGAEAGVVEVGGWRVVIVRIEIQRTRAELRTLGRRSVLPIHI